MTALLLAVEDIKRHKVSTDAELMCHCCWFTLNTLSWHDTEGAELGLILCQANIRSSNESSRFVKNEQPQKKKCHRRHLRITFLIGCVGKEETVLSPFMNLKATKKTGFNSSKELHLLPVWEDWVCESPEDISTFLHEQQKPVSPAASFLLKLPVSLFTATWQSCTTR